MNALVFQAVGQPLRLEERPSPRPSAGEAVVRLRAAALNRRDHWITQGQYPGLRPGVVLGSDGAGVVTETGEGVDPSWRGREVVINPGLGWGDDPAAQAERFQILGMPRDGTFAAEVAVPAAWRRVP
ncbi:MAG TPA: alcohol dehydrogenase catalytic domain-containing protein [Planctomycetota bacterium]|nr:alcohol dehydrogenase catalytic domain-containing protein [Planctomycetota bacterium]